MTVDKSLRQHYAMQGKVKNYLGKQKMVKAPKYWLSKPGHVKAKLAYITDEEEQILIDKNLYGSLKGKPNKGPAGLPSLQGMSDADRGYDSPSSSDHDHGGSGETWQHPIHTPAPAPQAPSPRAAGAESIGIDPTTGASTYESDAEPVENPERASVKHKLSKEITGLPDTTVQDPERASVKYKLPDTITGFDTRDPERYPSIKPKLPVAITGGVEPISYIDRFKNIDLKTKGKDFATSQVKKMVRNKIMKELGLSAFNPLLGLASFLFGKFAPKKKAALQSKIAAATKNLTKPREINPLDEFGYKGNVYAKKPTVHKESDDLSQIVSGKQDVVSKAVAQYTSKDIAKIRQARNMLETTMQSGTYRGRVLTRQQMEILENKYKELNDWLKKRDDEQIMMASTGGRVDKALTGRSRDI